MKASAIAKSEPSPFPTRGCKPRPLLCKLMMDSQVWGPQPLDYSLLDVGAHTPLCVCMGIEHMCAHVLESHLLLEFCPCLPHHHPGNLYMLAVPPQRKSEVSVVTSNITGIRSLLYPQGTSLVSLVPGDSRS